MSCLSKSELMLRGCALEVALLAKCGSVDAEKVDGLFKRAHAVLGEDDQFLEDIQIFCSAWSEFRQNKDVLFKLGNDLAEAVIRSQPDPDPTPQSQFEWQKRKDING